MTAPPLLREGAHRQRREIERKKERGELEEGTQGRFSKEKKWVELEGVDARDENKGEREGTRYPRGARVLKRLLSDQQALQEFVRRRGGGDAR